MKVEYAVLFTKVTYGIVSRNLGNTIYPTEELAEAAILIHNDTMNAPPRRRAEVVAVLRSVEPQ